MNCIAVTPSTPSYRCWFGKPGRNVWTSSRWRQAGSRALIRLQYALPEVDQLAPRTYLEEHAEGNPLYAGRAAAHVGGVGTS